ncbi:hypothetical protein E3T26_03345 [Cryobacterium sp. TMT1-21]|uniref:Hemagglutinin n=1 Tax=Cryobacterium shii TaxID=1259235 RepID=A0AAQ2C5M4_9MICO|nr:MULTISPECIES: hypothetical protein [Cryobacterium]TFC44946.1 hypothetical protein E3O49_10935 [Cryobacterium shii]TFC89625.1 hypothetical protein E3T24_00525 [Cryobacterium sp. TmT2-59]TFD11989.1 hypothetical protein E3T42_15640 [Cryobacterium sp. TMT4-10]TFD16870.1 hypothetical protein E3T26_03345 [Cryobacterium sp. TMT1-21]
MKTRLFRILTGAAAVILLSSLLTALSVVRTTDSAAAMSGSEFQPGNIISDQNFYNAGSMSEADVQAFFTSKSCSPRDGVPCLKDYSATTRTIASPEQGHCAQYTGGTAESAARIVWKVAQACGISPAVLIVLMQKEQSLLTNPSAYGYERAMGWGCPDSGPNYSASCDANYFGLFNQVYKSAWQFRQYTLYPVSIPGGGTRQYRVGNVYIQYHPNSACGGVNVNILNQATANLYLYTPYVPNAAALGNLYGTGDGCSAYGNRNFWRMYYDWFGNPTSAQGTPAGQISKMSAVSKRITLSGWAVDPDAWGTALVVDVQVDSSWTRLTANESLASVAVQFPQAGQNHGFSGSIVATKGAHTVCVYVQNVGLGSALSLGCRTIVVPDESPAGAITSLDPIAAGLTVSGWAVDPDALDQPVVLDAQVDSRWFTWTANRGSQAGADAYPGAGTSHGFSQSVPATIGAHTVCIYMRNLNLGSSSGLGCRTIDVPDTAAQGKLETATAVAGGISLKGWAVDPDAITAPLNVDVQVNSAWYRLPASSANPGAEAAFPGSGTNHGFAGTVVAATGTNTVCVYVKNAISGGPDASLGCRVLTVDGGLSIGPGSPQGAVSSLTGEAGALALTGWAIDGDAPTAPVKVDIQVDGKWLLWNADKSDPTAQSKFAGVGLNHGFSGSIPVSAGTHTVCVYLQNVGQGSAASLGCKQTATTGTPGTVGGPPQGDLVTATGGPGSVTLTGWAVDPDILTQPAKIDVQLDGQWLLWAADQPSAAAEAAVPGAGPNHGFTGSIPVPAGNHTVCVYVQNVGQGSSISLGCRAVASTAAAVAGGPPKGAILGASGGAGGIALTGWAVDPDVLTQAVKVDIQVDSQWLMWNADQNYPTADTAFPGAGAAHGFGGTIPVPAGNHTICVYLQNVGQGSAVSLGCRSVSTTAAAGMAGSPQGALQSVTGGVGGVSLTGWAVDPDILTQAVKVDVQIDSQWVLLTADQANPAAESQVPGSGTNHGFASTIPAKAGNHTVCVYLQNVGAGSATSLGCRAIATS